MALTHTTRDFKQTLSSKRQKALQASRPKGLKCQLAHCLEWLMHIGAHATHAEHQRACCVFNGSPSAGDRIEQKAQRPRVLSFAARFFGRCASTCHLSHFLVCESGMINDDFERDTNFLKLHVMEIINRKDSIKIADKQEEE